MKIRMAMGADVKRRVSTLEIRENNWPRTDEAAIGFLYGLGFTSIGVFEFELPDPPPLPPMPKVTVVQPVAVMESTP